MAEEKTGITGTAVVPEDSEGSQVIELDKYIPAFFTFIANKWSRTSSKLYLDEFGIGIEAWRVMVLLAIEGAIPAARIVQVIVMDKAAVSRSLRSLEIAGLVRMENDPLDARQRFAELTASGRALHDRIVGLALMREDRLLECLSDLERRTLRDLLARVHANLSVLDEDFSPNATENDLVEPR